MYLVIYHFLVIIYLLFLFFRHLFIYILINLFLYCWLASILGVLKNVLAFFVAHYPRQIRITPAVNNCDIRQHNLGIGKQANWEKKHLCGENVQERTAINGD